jgi:hypothetical protein
VDRDLETGEVLLELLHDRQVAPVIDLVLLVGATREQEPVQVVVFDQVPDFLVQDLGPRRRDHRLEDLLLAVIAIEPAGGRRDRKCRETVLAAAVEFRARILLERRRREADWPRLPAVRARLEFVDERPIEFRVLQVLDRRECVIPSH